MGGKNEDYGGIKEVSEHIYTDGKNFYLRVERVAIPLSDAAKGKKKAKRIFVKLPENILDEIKKLEGLVGSEQQSAVQGSKKRNPVSGLSLTLYSVRKA